MKGIINLWVNLFLKQKTYPNNMDSKYGNEYYCVDETLRSRLEAKLIKTTLGFKLVR